jgi:hypothetical protein
LGFDGFYVKEGGVKNLAVYDPTQLKSATGNIGTYDGSNPDIRFSREPVPLKFKVGSATMSTTDGQKFIDDLKKRIDSIEKFALCVGS